MSIKEETLKMKKWAVVGATNNQNRYGYKIVKRLQEHNYDVYPVNPNLEEIDGIKCYKTVSDIDVDIDVVDMVVNPKIGIKVMEEIMEKEIQYVWLQPGTRSELIRSYANNSSINIIEDCIYATLG